MTLPRINFDPDIERIFPGLKIGKLYAMVNVAGSNNSLDIEVEKTISQISGSVDSEDIRNIPGVKSLKQAFKKLGKDPNRYRPSAESLLRE